MNVVKDKYMIDVYIISFPVKRFICPGGDFLTWSWWSKKVLTHTLEFVSQTFTLLSDELNTNQEQISQHGSTAYKYLFYIHINSQTGSWSPWKSVVSPGDKVGVVGGEGHAEDPGGVATESACQVGVLSAKHG